MGEALEVDYLLRIAEVEKQTGLGRSSIYRRIEKGTFPLGLDLGGGQRRWRQSDITRWRTNLEPMKMRAPPALAEATAGGLS